MFKPESKILIVDDMMSIRKIVKRILTEMNFTNVTEAADGQLAWKAVTSDGPFDLIISDWNMPNMTGIDFLKNVRESDKHKDTVFILLTAESEESQVKTAIELKVDGYIVKPFTPDALKAKIANGYEKSKARTAA